MKTSISITGQMNGNFELLCAIKTYDCIEEKTGFGNFILHFNTKKEAKKALWDGYKYIRNDYTGTSLRYSKNGELYFDASSAKIIK